MQFALDNATVMQYGQQYTFTFKQSGIPFVAADRNEIVQAIAEAIPQAQSVAVTGESVFGSSVDVTFTYADPDNSDDVQNFGLNMALQMGSKFTLDSFQFVQAFGGPQGSQGAPDSDVTGLEDIGSGISSTALYVAGAIVIAVIAIKFL